MFTKNLLTFIFDLIVVPLYELLKWFSGRKVSIRVSVAEKSKQPISRCL